ncbi:hypothetical protein F4808DRAFT_409742 [Astrocystis sublimbata]|nr:hypothetical protein F4808DRAFT_409742 [Astrocystis sublimbata]
MGKISSLLSLTGAILSILSVTSAVDIDDIFTVQNGNNDGGCGSRAAVLDLWLSEGIDSLVVAIDAIDDYRNQPSVRRSMSVIFGIANNARRNTGPDTPIGEVRQYLQYILNFFNDIGHYSRDGYWLFCDSTFLSLHQPNFPALDFQANEILDQSSNPVPISAVPVYAARLAEDADNKPWWAGELTDLHAYYFAEDGGNYCLTDDLGVTARSEFLVQNGAGNAVPRDPDVASVIICPYAFDASPRPNNYNDANNLIQAGTNLADAVPKSATLLHEMFHVIAGVDFLSGGDEDCAYQNTPSASHGTLNKLTRVR